MLKFYEHTQISEHKS